MDMEHAVRRAQGGDVVALDRLIADLTPYLGRICGSIALGAGDDALQETLLAVVRNLRNLRTPEALHGWARTIAVRESLRVVRSSASTPVDPTDLGRMGDAHPDVTDAVDVREVLASLDPQHRAVLVLREVEGLSEAEAAEVLGVAVGTVKSRTARAKRAFVQRWSA